MKMKQLDSAAFIWQCTESVVADDHPAHLIYTVPHNSDACFLVSGLWPCKGCIPNFNLGMTGTLTYMIVNNVADDSTQGVKGNFYQADAVT